MKKLISFVIAISVLLSISVRAEEKEITLESTDIETISATMQKKVAVLSAIDILRGYEDGSFRLNQKITRAEFAVLVVRALGYEDLAMGEGAKSVSFADTEGHWAVENIEFAKSLGLFSGSDGYFYPDNYITGNEAVKVMVCMLGYGDIAVVDGGWPKGYYKVAANLGLLSEVEEGYLTTEEVTRNFIVALLFNTLNTHTLGINFGSGKISYTPEGETILQNIHKVYDGKGRVTATKYTDLFGAKYGTYDGTVVIDDEKYYPGETDAHELIGYNVEFYYCVEGWEDDKTLVYICPQGFSKEIVIDSAEINSIVGSKLYYSTKGKKVEIEKSALVFYNKRAYPDFVVNDLNIDSGELKFLDSDGNGTYDIIFISEATSLVVGTSSEATMKLIDYFDPSIFVELNPKDNADGVIYSIAREGKEVDFSELSKPDTLSVYASKDGEIIDIIATNNTLEGKVTGVSKENGKRFITIEDKIYKVLRSCSEEFQVGAEYVIYLNHKGEVVGVEIKNADSRFAYLLSVKRNKEDDASLLLKILDSDGKIKTLATRSKVRIDNETITHSADVRTALQRNSKYSALDSYYQAVYNGGNGNPDAYNFVQLLIIKTNSKNEITQIITEKKYNTYLSISARQSDPSAPGYTEDELCDLELKYDGLCRHNLDGDARYFTRKDPELGNQFYVRFYDGMNAIDGQIALTSKTKFFILSTDYTNEDKYKVATGNGFSSNEKMVKGSIQVYNMNKSNEAMAIVLTKVADTIKDTSSFFLVDKVFSGLNSDGDVTKIIKGLYRGEEVSFACIDASFAQDSSGNDYKRGDIIRIALKDNEISDSKMVVDRSAISVSRSSFGQLENHAYHDLGKVYNAANDRITLSNDSTVGSYSDRRTYPIPGSVYIYDEEENSVYIGSRSDIRDYVHNRDSKAVAYIHIGGSVKPTGLVFYKFR